LVGSPWLKDVDPVSVISRTALASLPVLRKAMLGDVQRQSPGD
jgi:phenylacetate-CoA ligase